MDEPKPIRTVAVALDYDPGASGAPKVTASGYGYIADNILEMAFACGINV